MKKLILIIFIILLSGCGGIFGKFNANKWSKPGISQEQVNREFKECEMYGKAHASMNPFMAIELTHDCMVNKGYK